MLTGCLLLPLKERDYDDQISFNHVARMAKSKLLSD